MHELNEYVRKAIEVGSIWVTWAVGGIIGYLFKVYYWEPFRKSLFFLNIIFASYIGWFVWEFIPDDVSIKSAIISASWIGSHWFIKLIEEKWVKLIFNKIFPNSKENGTK